MPCLTVDMLNNPIFAHSRDCYVGYHCILKFSVQENKQNAIRRQNRKLHVIHEVVFKQKTLLELFNDEAFSSAYLVECQRQMGREDKT